MWAQNEKKSIESFPPLNKIFSFRPRHRRHRSPSSAHEVEQCVSVSGGSEKNRNVICVAAHSRCCRAQFHQNKTEKDCKYSLLSSLLRLDSSIDFDPNKLVATIVEGFNRGSVGSARVPLWMEA